jgi:hypothetical protein
VEEETEVSFKKLDKSVSVCEHIGKPETYFGERKCVTGNVNDTRQCKKQQQQ